jgi:two-component system sensor histidine kinase UhpB
VDAADPTASARQVSSNGGARPVSTGHKHRAFNPVAAYRRQSLYSRVVVVNATVLFVATVVLLVTPEDVPFPHTVTDAVVILLGLVVATGANALLLRLAFTPLTSLATTMREIDLLRPRTRLQAAGGAEVEQVISTFNEMLDRLELERLESNRRTHLAREGERQRIGHELHDEIGQRLTGILLELQRTREHCSPETAEELAHAQELTRGTLDEVGRIAWTMRPGMLDDLGISKALEALVEGVADTARPSVSLRIEDPLPACSPDVEIVLYRVAQEGLTNSLRHAESANIWLELAARGDAGVVLEIGDDGHGLAAGAAEGPGLRGMRERALAIGADLSIESTPGVGLWVRLLVADPSAGA